MMTIPVVPTERAAVAETLPQVSAAQIPTGAVPAVVVPAVFFVFENKLRLLNQAQAVCGGAEIAGEANGPPAPRSSAGLELAASNKRQSIFVIAVLFVID